MKSKSVVIIFLAISFMVSCKKEADVKQVWSLGNHWKGSQAYGKVHALRNGEPWEASGIASQDDTDPECAISFGTFDQIDSVQREDVSFSYLPYRVGFYKVSQGGWTTINNALAWVKVANRYALQYDDLVSTVFYPDTTKNNWIRIESIDSTQKIIKGKFDVTYKLSHAGEEKTNYPREVHFSEGVFEVTVRQ